MAKRYEANFPKKEFLPRVAPPPPPKKKILAQVIYQKKILASQKPPTPNFSNGPSLKFSLTTITHQTVRVIQKWASTFLAGLIYLGQVNHGEWPSHSWKFCLGKFCKSRFSLRELMPFWLLFHTLRQSAINYCSLSRRYTKNQVLSKNIRSVLRFLVQKNL